MRRNPWTAQIPAVRHRFRHYTDWIRYDEHWPSSPPRAIVPAAPLSG
jgi:hypothetical protein